MSFGLALSSFDQIPVPSILLHPLAERNVSSSNTWTRDTMLGDSKRTAHHHKPDVCAVCMYACLYVYMHVGMYVWADEHVVHTYGALQIVACFELAEADRFPGSNYRRLCSLSSPTSPAGERAVTPQKHALLPPPTLCAVTGNASPALFAPPPANKPSVELPA